MRLPDWKPRLTAWLAEVARRPFCEGSHDCALFAAGAVQAMTGRDLAEGWRGTYASTAEGLRLLRERGFADHIDLASRYFDEIPLAFAAPGDLAEVDTGEGPALGLIQGEMVFVLRPSGLGLVVLTGARRAFRVS